MVTRSIPAATTGTFTTICKCLEIRRHTGFSIFAFSLDLAQSSSVAHSNSVRFRLRLDRFSTLFRRTHELSYPHSWATFLFLSDGEEEKAEPSNERIWERKKKEKLRKQKVRESKKGQETSVVEKRWRPARDQTINGKMSGALVLPSLTGSFLLGAEESDNKYRQTNATRTDRVEGTADRLSGWSRDEEAHVGWMTEEEKKETGTWATLIAPTKPLEKGQIWWTRVIRLSGKQIVPALLSPI